MRGSRRRGGIKLDGFERLNLGVLKQQESVESQVFSLSFSDEKRVIEEDEVVVGRSDSVQEYVVLTFAAVAASLSDELKL